ncbi:MAG: class I SAM-dependent methyltransferase, partial [Betaproteobacteria bacterium]
MTAARTSTVEPQYEEHVKLKQARGVTRLGIEKSANWHSDPRRLLFVLSRYKFVAKMFSGKGRVLEVGCGDAFPLPIVLQEVAAVHAIDIDPVFIADIEERLDDKWPFTYEVHDMLTGPVSQPPFEAAYSLDVLEHIPVEREHRFLRNVSDSLLPTGELIIGMPSLESQAYASPGSKVGHINCKSAPALKSLLNEFFHSVFMFSMNDEVVHTGYHPMAQY